MSSSPHPPKVPASQRPNDQDCSFDLDRALTSIVAISSRAPSNAFTAETLGLERSGHGVVVSSDGIVLTIGYLIAETDEIWVTLANGRVERGSVVAYDQESGFGLLQILAHVDLPAIPFGVSSNVKVGDSVILAGSGGREHCVAAKVVAVQSFTGYWEYVVDDAIFTSPSHPYWGGAPLLSAAGELLGIASLQVAQEGDESEENVNMVVPIDALKPVFEDLVTIGRRRTKPRPWLGLFVGDVDDHVVVVGVSHRGPAKGADVRVGDLIIGVNGELVTNAGDFFKKIWATGPAGTRHTLLLQREGRRLDTQIKSTDRTKYFVVPKLH